jgi:hypothetical protein
MSDISAGNDNDNNTNGAKPRNGRRRKLVAGVLGAFIVAGIAYAIWWALVS